VIIFRYLSKEIMRATLIATLILLVIFVTNQSVQFLERTAAGQLPATALLQAIALQIPLFSGYLLPLGLYLGAILTLSRMYIDSEMTILYACGVSRFKILGMVFLVAMFVAVIVTWLMMVVVPKAQGATNVLFNRAAVTASVQQVIPGRFMSFGNDQENSIVLYAGGIGKHHVLSDVFLAKKVMDKWGMIVAKSARERKMHDSPVEYLVFDQGDRYVGEPGEKNFQLLQFQEYGARVLLENVPDVNAVQYYSIPTLWRLQKTNLSAAAELQWRMAMPISVLIFALLAVPLSETKPRHGKFIQILPAMIIYLCYGDLLFLTRSWIQAGRISATLGMWWVHAAMLIVVLMLIWYRWGRQR